MNAKTWPFAILLVALGGCQVDDEAPPAVEVEPEGGVITIWTDASELFFEHPSLVAGTPGDPWTVHLTALSTFRPVTDGVVQLRFVAPDGSESVHTTERPSRPGVYEPAPSFEAPGAYDLTVAVTGPEVTDEIYVGPIIVHRSWDDVPRLAPEPPVGITFLKEQQWPIAYATVEAATRSIETAIPAAGAIVPAANRRANVTAPVDGIILAERNRDAPIPGRWVDRGQPLVSLAPASGDNAFAQQRATVERLEREVERLERLVASDAVPARRLDEAKHDLEVARATVDPLGTDGAGGYDLAVPAPIAGTVDTRDFALGERVQAGQLLMTIVDTRSVWLEMFVPAADAARVAAVTGATFAVEGADAMFRTDRVVAVGQAVDPTRRALPVTMAVANPDRLFRVGMMATGRLLVGEPTRGVAVPAPAIRDEDGILVAYVQIGGESFERRAVTVGPSDGEWTIVLSGVRRGERVVTLGAYQVRLASLNTSEISDHGHPH